MERAGRLIARLKSKSALSPEELVRAAWPAAVGKRLSAHTVCREFAGRQLVVEVQDEIWSRNLSTLKSQILANLNGLMGVDAVGDISFRVPAPKRPPQREEAPRPATSSRPFASRGKVRA